MASLAATSCQFLFPWEYIVPLALRAFTRLVSFVHSRCIVWFVLTQYCTMKRLPASQAGLLRSLEQLWAS